MVLRTLLLSLISYLVEKAFYGLRPWVLGLLNIFPPPPEPHLSQWVVVLEQDTFYPSLVLVQPRKTCHCLTERLLMERKESNQTKLADNQDWNNILCFLISLWSLFQVQSDLPFSIINYGISKQYAGSQVSDRCPLGYLCFLINFWSLFQVQSYLPLSIVNYGVSKHYAGFMVSDRCPLGYLFTEGVFWMGVKQWICSVYGLYQLKLWWPSSWCNFDNLCKSFVSSCPGKGT